ncbi:37S ribosomal protein S28, mitochondrial [Dermatophagoides farinae]|uniref:37S ribosomal protein S28, mitochondrial n=1 Tax=Dermatophagoides farinae TaxID=6954 RepID=A0A922HXU5_DERFA|nr:37S ribosomal protein S28, mitochondrial [Dermatophagoides farinae]
MFRPIFRVNFLIRKNFTIRNSSLILSNRWIGTSSAIKWNKSNNEQQSKSYQHHATFATLFRDSPYCQLGLPEEKIVIGEIVQIVDDDIYIDFGFKFLAVCRRPKQNSVLYARGAKVKVRINDLELSDRFLGSTQDMTLLEADVTLLGLHSSPIKIATPSLKSGTT